MWPRFIFALEAAKGLTHTPPGGGGWVQKLALEATFCEFLSVGRPAAGGKFFGILSVGKPDSLKESEFLPRRITKFSACGGLFCWFDWNSPSTARTSEGSTSRTRIFYKLLCLGTLSDANNHKIARPSAPRRSAEPISRSKRYHGRGKLWIGCVDA